MTDPREKTSETRVDRRTVPLGHVPGRAGPGVSRGEPRIDRTHPTVYEPSFAQQRLWFLHQLEPGSCLYNMASVWLLEGPLDVDLLVRSVREIVRRHDSLRTVFAVDGGNVSAVVVPDVTPSIPILEMGDLPAGAQDSWIQEMVTRQAERPFDLEQGPLLRVTLLRVSSRMHVLVVIMHHIISDGWSLRILRRELQTLYNAAQTGESRPLAELPVQYADYACWERQWLQGETLQTQLSYWRRQLHEVSALELPADRPRPRQPSCGGSHVRSLLPATVAQSLRALGRESKCTLFMVLLTGFSILLHRLAGQTDVCVGIPVANRNRREIEDLIGFFVNTLVIRIDLSRNPTFHELLDQVRQTALEAYAHQDLPFERLVQEMAPQRDLSRNPLFQVFLNMDSPEDEPLRLHGLAARRVPRENVTSKFDLTLYVTNRDGPVAFDLVYNRDLFDRPRMVEMLAQLEHLLAQSAADPHQRIDALDLVTPGMRQILPDPRGPLTPRWEGPVEARVFEHARRDPRKTAVKDGVQTWTYAELDAVSNQLAGYLRHQGIQPNDTVAIYGSRSVLLVVGILGILRTGAAFTILDPAYPAARLRDCLEAVKPKGWLELQAQTPAWNGVPGVLPPVPCRLRLGPDPRESGPWAEYATSRAHVADIDPDGLAYIAFTSGSTHHRPKGILGTHRPISHFLRWHCETFGLTPSDRFSMLSGLSHDPLLRDIFTPLWLGGTLCIPTQEEMQMPWRLAPWMCAEEVSVAHMTPLLADLLTSENPPGVAPQIPSLRYVFFGGDLLAARHVQQLRHKAPNVTCVNYYGATETPQAMSYYDIPDLQRGDGWSAPDGIQGRVPIGRGIEGAQLLVVNGARRMAGVGERGEIWVRSPYLARGYLNEDVSTAEKFIVNPFTGSVGDRVYRTGDFGCYRPDGCVECLGRIDRQVKIRGFRVEPAEIESALCSHPAVRQAAVLQDGDPRAGNRLVAYAATEGGISTLALRGYLRTLLPEYMIPLQFVILDALPLTPNGKIDLRRLPRPENHPSAPTPAADPHPGMEKDVAGIWRDVIGVDHVQRHDTFFDLGGHSLLVARTVMLLEKRFGIRVPFREFFNQTLAQFAGYCERKVSEKQRHEQPRA